MKEGCRFVAGAFCACALASCSMFSTFSEPPTMIKVKDAQTFIKSAADPQMAPLILDVRPDTNWIDGHIEGAKWIPLAQLDDRIDEIESYRETPVLVYSHAGQNSLDAASVLQSNRFTQIMVLDGGLAAWVSAGLPIVKGPFPAPPAK